MLAGMVYNALRDCSPAPCSKVKRRRQIRLEMSTRPLHARAYGAGVHRRWRTAVRRCEALLMMFLARSAFWLSLVYAHMPLDGGEVIRAVDDTRSAVVAGAATAVRAKCVDDPAACRAILNAAAGAVLAPAGERLASAPIPARRIPAKGAKPFSNKPSANKPSANSLSAADLATPWRGRPAKSGA